MNEYTILRSGMIRRESDRAFVPADPSNGDYAEFMAWVAAGNTADVEPAMQMPNLATRTELMDRMTDAERVAIMRWTRETDQGAVWWAYWTAAADPLILDMERVQQGFAAMAAAGVLSADRIAAISAPPAGT